jgi:hypothetical protein
MTPLPPDFWTKPYPGGMFGILVGGIIAGVLGWAFSNYAVRRGWWTHSIFATRIIVGVFTIVGVTVGSRVGALVVFYD